MNVAQSMTFIVGAKKYIVSNGPPKLLSDCPWIDLSEVKALVGKSALSDTQKVKLRAIPPLPLPAGSLTVNCPVVGKPISMALNYYAVGGWLINSLTLHYIDMHDILLPAGLLAAIEEY